MTDVANEHRSVTAGSQPLDARNEAALPVSSTSATARRIALQHAALSAVIPGGGQLAQGRWLTATAQFSVVIGYLLGVYGVGPTAALFLALFWNAYSAVEAYRYERAW